MIKGKLTTLRAVEYNDLDKLKFWRNNPDFRKNFREHKELNSVNQNLWFEKISDSKNDYMFSIIENNTNKLIGACGLLYIDWIIRSADISMYIGKDDLYIDNDLAFDTSKNLFKYGFDTLHLEKLWMELYEFDKAKIDFLTKKFNFKIDGKLRNNCFYEGQFYDSYIVSLLKTEFKYI